LAASDKLALADGSIAEAATAAKIAEVANSKFCSINALVNNAGTYFSKQFIDYTIDDLRSLVSVNVEDFFFISQLVIKQMLSQKVGASIVNITTTVVDHPIARVTVGSNDHKRRPRGRHAEPGDGIRETGHTRERRRARRCRYAYTPIHKDHPKDVLRTLRPMRQIVGVKDLVDAIVYLTDAGQVTGEVLHVDGGARVGKW
jgi:NAD(P)-dependent dehydrogenase (short-subunit alcohol dehydrogenase family)